MYIYIHIYVRIYACGVLAIVVGNRHDDLSSNLERICISYSDNALWKSMDSVIFPPAIGKY